jgi:hypothetical protein
MALMVASSLKTMCKNGVRIMRQVPCANIVRVLQGIWLQQGTGCSLLFFARKAGSESVPEKHVSVYIGLSSMALL